MEIETIKKPRSRSASSPNRVPIPLTAPAADVPVTQNELLSEHDIINSFVSGLDKWNGILKNALLVRLYFLCHDKV